MVQKLQYVSGVGSYGFLVIFSIVLCWNTSELCWRTSEIWTFGIHFFCLNIVGLEYRRKSRRVAWVELGQKGGRWKSRIVAEHFYDFRNQEK